MTPFGQINRSRFNFPRFCLLMVDNLIENKTKVKWKYIRDRPEKVLVYYISSLTLYVCIFSCLSWKSTMASLSGMEI